MPRLLAFTLLVSLPLGCTSRTEVTVKDDGRATTPPSVTITPPLAGEKGKDKPKPSPATFPPDDWTHRDLANYLEKKGFKVRVRPTPLGDTENRITVMFDVEHKGKEGALSVYRYTTREQARVGAGAMGDGGMNFGLFAIGVVAPHATTPQSEIEEMANKIREALR
jgi:hypothetical protein